LVDAFLLLVDTLLLLVDTLLLLVDEKGRLLILVSREEGRYLWYWVGLLGETMRKPNWVVMRMSLRLLEIEQPSMSCGWMD
jgi:hypothetical protein